ncbi:MAG: ABC-2 family transporter protein [Eubacterium sp.]|nr:ABC-2 family transporter protein [Eubacterium sp.]
MKKYFACMRCGFLDGCASRGYFITGMLGNFVQAVVMYFVWKSIFAYHQTVNGFTWELMKQYVFVSFLCSNVFSMGFEMHTAQRIIQGDIILDLLKPASYRGMLFFRMLGTAGMEFAVGTVLIGSIYLAVNGTYGMHPLRTMLFLLSLFLGAAIKFGIQYLFSLFCFYTDNAYGVTKAREVLTNFFSGALVPLAMFPGVLGELVKWLPFQGILYTPCCIWTGMLAAQEMLRGIFMQIIWIFLLWAAGTVFGKKAFGVISMYGG